jgi:hypothetical protein
MKKQTAVKWLVHELNRNIDFIPMDKLDMIRDIVQQAKAMEKQQIIDANEDCSTNELGELFTGEQYYNETYGN